MLIKLITAPAAILLDAVSFIFSAAAISWIAKPEPKPMAPAHPESWWSEAAAGIGFVLTHPLLRPLALRMATVSLAWGFYGTLYVYYAIEVLKLSTVALGIVIALGGIGNLIGALAARYAGTRYAVGKVLIIAAVWQGLMSLLIPLASEPGWFSVACLGAAQLFGDVAYPVFNINELTLRQKASPPQMLGRVNACLQLLVKGLFPVGALLGGGLAVAIGTRQTLLLCALGILASTLWLIFSPVRKLRGHEG
jgi:predicted MFS family arabinose efflux permease